MASAALWWRSCDEPSQIMPKRDEGDDPEADPGEPERAIEQPGDKGRGDPHQGDREDKPDHQHKRVVARHPGDGEDIVERHREVGHDDLQQRLCLRLLARKATRLGPARFANRMGRADLPLHLPCDP